MHAHITPEVVMLWTWRRRSVVHAHTYPSPILHRVWYRVQGRDYRCLDDALRAAR